MSGPRLSPSPVIMKLEPPFAWSRPSTKEVHGPAVVALQRRSISSSSRSFIIDLTSMGFCDPLKNPLCLFVRSFHGGSNRSRAHQSVEAHDLLLADNRNDRSILKAPDDFVHDDDVPRNCAQLLNESSAKKIICSRQSSSIALTKRSAWEFKFGLLGGNCTDSLPASARMLRNSPVYSGSRHG